MTTLAASLAAPAVASAAETVIGFDHFPGGEPVPPGTIVTNQWKAEGLDMGKAEEFAQPSVPGNCGAPRVEEGTAAVPAASPPNYVSLPTCVGAAPTQGTFGALLGPPRGSLSVEVRNLTSSPNVQVRVVGYSSGGTQVGEGHGEATNGAWQPITVTLNGEGKISYFAISTALVTSQKIAIDNLSFEAVAEEHKEEHGKEGGGGGSRPTPPTANLALQTPNPHAGQPLTLSGAGSTPGSGHIISYGWNFGGGANVETSTGTNPIAHIMLAPGAHTITLTVTNSNNEHSSTHFGVSLPTVKVHIPDGGEGECLTTLEIGNAHLLAECIQKLPGGGYVIAGPQLGLNGMSLVPKAGGFLKIKTSKLLVVGGGAATELYGAQVDVELLNTPIGDMVVGGRDLEAEPLVLALSGGPPPKFEGAFHDFAAPRARAADKESKTLLMAIGVGRECEAGEKKAGCCPPKNGLTACAKLPGNFPLTGQVDVYLNSKGQALFDVQVGLSLKEVNFEATGALEIRANLEKGIELQSLQFEIGEASLAPIFKVKDASFIYYFPEYEDESKRDSWQAKGTLTFGEEIVELKAELTFKKGEFQSASMQFKTSPGVPIYPGIDLNEIGASIGVNPLAFGGSLGAKIAELLQLELAFKFREATSTELGFFGGEGKLSYKDDEIATLAADVFSDGYVDAQVTFDLHFPFDSKEPVIKVSGGAGFWDEPASGLWQARGNVYLKLWIISAEVAGLINNQYAAGCLHVGAEGVFGGGVQGRYRFSDGNIAGGLFGNDNCTDQLKQYSQKPLVKHSGGFVKEESLRFLPETGNLSGGLVNSAGAAIASAASAESDSFSLPAGTMGEELRITSASGTPVVALLGPGGQTYTTPTTPGKLVTVPGQFMSAVAPDPHQVLVLLRHPKGGEWRIQAVHGSPAIATVETSEEIPPATVRARVSRKGARRWSLAYKLSHYIAGTRVRFVERGHDSTHVLGTVAKASGTLSFTPQAALGRARNVLAYLLDGEGATTRELVVAHYSAPPASRPARPRGVRIVRRRSSALLTWSPVSGARSYRIKVRGSDGRLETLFRKPGRRSVTVPNVLGFESFTATVTAVGADLLPGPSASARLAAVKLRHATAKAHRGKKK